MIFGTPQYLIAWPVAAGAGCVMHARAVIRNDVQHWPTPVTDHDIADAGHNSARFRMTMRHRHDFVQIAVTKRPKIADLCAMRIDNADT